MSAILPSDSADADLTLTRSSSYRNATSAKPVGTAVSGDDDEDAGEILQPATFGSLFRFCTNKDVIYLIIGILFNIAQGAGQPILVLVFTKTLDTAGQGQTEEELRDNIKVLTVYFMLIGAGMGLCSAIGRSCLKLTATNIGMQTKAKYLESICRHETEWHDSHPSSMLEVRLAESFPKIHEALDVKLAAACQMGGMAGLSLILAFVYSPELSAVCIVPFVLAAGGGMWLGMNWMSSIDEITSRSYEAAAGLGDEVVSLVRTVVAFGTADREKSVYMKKLELVKNRGKEIGRQFGIVKALDLVALQPLLFALAYWYGAILVRRGEASFVDVFNAMQFVMMIGFGGAGVAAYNKDVGIARMAAARIYSVIDYESKIDGLSEEGIKSDRLNGSLAVSGINFAYPSAPEIQILHDLSFSVAKGKSVALVGHSGCGKSTIVNLLMRFYSPNSGSIKIDGTKIEKYNLPWLRGKIGLVAQQPPLLPGTIRDNVAIGKEHATQDEIEAACKAANAHDFIVGFPDGYNTNVGSLGNKLSGGQRQRVAIASVIIAQPEILILDEATSALDKISEAKFQKVMDETADGRATVVIAHRLSTIRDCDEILVFDHGHVVERGSHETLVELGGIYYGMLHKQGVEEESDKTTDDASLATLTDECGEGFEGFGASQMQEKAAPSSDVQVALTGADVDAKAKADAQMSGKDEKEKEQKKKEKEQQKAAANWVWSMAKPDRGFFWLAVLASLICGFTVPLGNLVLAYILLVMLGSWDTEIYTCDMAASAFTFTSSYANPENPNYSAVQVCQYFCSTELERGCRLCMPYIDGNTTSAYSISYNDTCSQTTECGPAGCAASFTQPGDEDAINELLPYLVYCAVACSLFGFVNGYSQYIAGEGLTFRLRALFYDHFLKQSMGWHDAHATSELTESLAIDAAAARKLQLDQYPAVVGAMVGIFGSLFLGFFYCWQWSLVVMAVAPVIIFFQSLEMALIMGKETNVSADQENASNAEKNHGVMMIQNQKMIAGVGRSKEFLGRYIDKVDASMGDLKAQLAKVAVLSFLSMFVTMGLFLSFSFWWAFELQIDGHCNNEEFMKSFIPFMFGIFMAPMMMMLVPDKTKAVPAITHSYLLLNEEDTTKVPSNDTSSGKSASKVDEAVIELKDVKFAYPTRLQAQVLNGASLSIKAGQTVAIVGGSGCGKSTVLHLLQKNYPIQGGEILIGGKNINDLDTEVYREQIATVEQEPKLFNRKIRDNIAYRPQEAPVTIEAIQAAAKSAFAHTFIEGIQDTYDFVVGKFGSRVSGGQRQRIAIARSLFASNDVKLLLLDEATSALDNESEREVQAALETFQEGRTTVIVAHRLSTIKAADCIFVMKDGKVVEQGTFAELIAEKGEFFEFYKDEV